MVNTRSVLLLCSFQFLKNSKKQELKLKHRNIKFLFFAQLDQLCIKMITLCLNFIPLSDINLSLWLNAEYAASQQSGNLIHNKNVKVLRLCPTFVYHNRINSAAST